MSKGKRHVPTAETRQQVETMAACGLPEQDIGKVLAMDPKTLRKYYPDELDRGAIKATSLVAQKLFAKAMAGDIAAMIFWLKANPHSRKAGWTERHVVAHEGTADGPPIKLKGLDPKRYSNAELAALEELLSKGGPPDGSPGSSPGS